MYLYIKALHIVFVVSWFAGLFYMIRLYIYEVEAQDKETKEKEILTAQLQLMADRLWHIITWPAALLTTVFGIWMLFEVQWITSTWMQVKLGFILLLFGYHIYSYRLHKQFKKGVYKWTSNQLRIWNEGATLLLFAIVFLAVLKTTFSWVYGVVGISSLGIMLMLGIKLYRRLRK